MSAYFSCLVRRFVCCFGQMLSCVIDVSQETRSMQCDLGQEVQCGTNWASRSRLGQQVQCGTAWARRSSGSAQEGIHIRFEVRLGAGAPVANAQRGSGHRYGSEHELQWPKPRRRPRCNGSEEGCVVTAIVMEHSMSGVRDLL